MMAARFADTCGRYVGDHSAQSSANVTGRTDGKANVTVLSQVSASRFVAKPRRDLVSRLPEA